MRPQRCGGGERGHLLLDVVGRARGPRIRVRRSGTGVWCVAGGGGGGGGARPASGTWLARHVEAMRIALGKPVERAAIVTGLYIFALGTLLLLSPGALHLIIPKDSLKCGWIRLLGLVGQVFGMYYYSSAVAGEFYRCSVYARFYLAVAMSFLVARQSLPKGAMFIALTNALGAASMWGALRHDATKSSARESQ